MQVALVQHDVNAVEDECVSQRAEQRRQLVADHLSKKIEHDEDRADVRRPQDQFGGDIDVLKREIDNGNHHEQERRVILQQRETAVPVVGPHRKLEILKVLGDHPASNRIGFRVTHEHVAGVEIIARDQHGGQKQEEKQRFPVAAEPSQEKRQAIAENFRGYKGEEQNQQQGKCEKIKGSKNRCPVIGEQSYRVFSDHLGMFAGRRKQNKVFDPR